MQRLAAAVIARIAASIADRWFDQHVRTAILEGVAGITPHTWTRDTANGLKKALNHLHIPADSPWAARDSGMYAAFVRTATTTLSKSDLYDAAEDLIQSVISGASLPGTAGGELYAVGRQVADLVGQGGGFENARALVLRHIKQRALVVIRGRDRARARTGPTIQEGRETDDGRIEQLPDVSAYSGYAKDLAFMDFLSGPDADEARYWLRDLWAKSLRPSDWKVVQAWLDNPSKNQTQLANELGLSSGSFIGKAIARARDVAIEAVKKNPPDFVRKLRMKEVLAPLGISVRKASSDLSPDNFHVSYPNPRTIRILVYTDGSRTYSGFVEARVGPNQVDDLVRQFKYAGFIVDPDDIESAIEMA